jgi:hypothetical protein
MSAFVKDITYPPADVYKDPQRLAEFMQIIFDGRDAGAYTRMSILMLQARFGAQMWVTKDVSDDLQAADLNPDDIKFEEIEWPAKRLEVFFEDPSIPSFLAALFTNEEQRQDLGRAINGEADIVTIALDQVQMDKPLIHIQAEDEEASMVSLTYTPEDVDKFAAGDDLPENDERPSSGWSVNMSHDEEADLRQLTVLLFKVLLLASSEGHSIRRTRDKPTRKQGGKPGFKNRPATDRLIVEYLPRHFVERRQAAEEEGNTHKFNGRRGHWRRFRSEKFVNMKGKKKFIYPIPGPDGTVPRKKFVVRKVSGS